MAFVGSWGRTNQLRKAAEKEAMHTNRQSQRERERERERDTEDKLAG